MPTARPAFVRNRVRFALPDGRSTALGIFAS
jgi:hypothetical protein